MWTFSYLIRDLFITNDVFFLFLGGVSGSHQATPIVVLNQNGHPNPMQLLPVFSSARTVTSVAAARPIKVAAEDQASSGSNVRFF